MRPLPDVGSKYGAPMGRRDTTNDTSANVEFEVERLVWVDGDYDLGGAYWGSGNPGDHIFRFQGESEAGIEEVFVRAKSLEQAKDAVMGRYPNATFAAAADLEAFLAAYRQTALWSSSNDRHESDPDNEAEMLDGSRYNLAEEAEAGMRASCEEFLAAHGHLVAEAKKVGRSIEDCGHDFWLTRCDHGTGFWDRGLGELGDKLSRAAKSFGNVDLYVGDDDLIYSTEDVAVAPSGPSA